MKPGRNSGTCLFLLSVAMAAIMAAESNPAAAQIFSKVTNSEISVPRGRTFGGGWLDLNNDGYPDILANNNDQADQVYINNWNGTFSLSTDSAILSLGSYYSGAAWGDFDNNGFNDLFVTTLEGGNHLLTNRGASGFQVIETSPVNAIPGIHLHCTWVDYDNDGWLDLFVPTVSSLTFARGGGTVNHLFHNNGDGTFTEVTGSALTAEPGNNQCANFSDIDNDGDMDLFVTEWGMDNQFFRNDGDGTFTKITGTEVTSNTQVSMSCCWGDYNNDGFTDLFVGNGSNNGSTKQKNLLYRNNGDGSFTKVLTGDIANFEGCTWTCAWGDVNNDGFLDLFAGQLNDPNVVFLNNGSGGFDQVDAFDSPSSSTSGGGFGDYDNDGYLDLFVANANGTGNSLYHNTGNGNNWIQVTCLGTTSNRSAIGAKVRIKATIGGLAVWQMREINANQGFRSLSDLRVHFGLGNVAVIDSLVIEWPSKERTVQTNIAANRFLTIREPMPAGHLKAGFSAYPTAGYSPLTVEFTDASLFDESDSITAWSWDFDGDGEADSHEKNPTYTFSCYEGREYTVSLTVSNGSAADSVTKTNLVKVLPMGTQNVALARNATASSVKRVITTASKAVDGLLTTSWTSTATDTQWIRIELDSLYSVGRVALRWGADYAVQYVVQSSLNGSDWTDLQSVDAGDGQTDEFSFAATRARYIRVYATRSSAGQGYALCELEVYRPALLHVENGRTAPREFTLGQNYPNPFNPATSIRYTLATTGAVTLEVFDILGRKVATLVDGVQQAGPHEVRFAASDLSSGVYLYRLESARESETRAMMLLK